MHAWPAAQTPQLLLQPSAPHAFPVQSGTQLPHFPAASSQVSGAAQLPQFPPQPSGPHARPEQAARHGPLESEVRCWSSSVRSQAGRGASGGIVWSVSVRTRIRAACFRTSPSVSKSTPTVALLRATGPTSVAEWQFRHRLATTALPDVALQGGGGALQAAANSTSGMTERRTIGTPQANARPRLA